MVKLILSLYLVIKRAALYGELLSKTCEVVSAAFWASLLLAAQKQTHRAL